MKKVAMFGSARTRSTQKLYRSTVDAAKLLVNNGWTVATGGGPGLMEAANKGAKAVCDEGVCSLGYSIFLPFEAETNAHVQEDHHHKNFFTRLEEFSTCDAFIALPGGWGTLLEILTVVQLLQVNHMEPRPLILVGAENAVIMERAEYMLKSSGYVGTQEGPFWKLASNPISAARLLLKLTSPEEPNEQRLALQREQDALKTRIFGETDEEVREDLDGDGVPSAEL